jgi:cysteine synthase A
MSSSSKASLSYYARVLVKWEGANPTGSMKDWMAVAIACRARKRGDLAPGQRVAEFTGGCAMGTARALRAERDPDDVVTTVACDTGLKYLDGDLFAK